MTMTEEQSAALVTYEMAEALLLASKNPRMRDQYERGVVNPIVLADAIGCRPQMIYTYIKQGKIQTVEGVQTNSTQKIVLEWTYAVAWAQRYLNKKAEKQAKIDAQLAGEDTK